MTSEWPCSFSCTKPKAVIMETEKDDSNTTTAKKLRHEAESANEVKANVDMTDVLQSGGKFFAHSCLKMWV